MTTNAMLATAKVVLILITPGLLVNEAGMRHSADHY
jgi:hypothetical protein